MIFEKIRERLQEKEDRVYQNFEHLLDEGKEKLAMLSEVEVQTYSDAIDIINQVEAEYNNGWIKCEDKLPETLDSYLVVVKMKYEWETEWEYQTDVAYYTMEDGYIDGWNTFNDWNEGQECHIVYWQPLPQPPKGE